MQHKTRFALLGLLALSLGLGGCSALTTATSGNQNSLQAQVAQHEQILQQLNMQLSGVQPAQADTWSQVQSMRQEINSLRGELDALNNAFNQTGGTQNLADTVARHDRALRLIESQLAVDLQLNTPAIAQPNYGATIPSGSTPQITPQVSTPPASSASSSTTIASQTGQPGVAQSLYDSGLAAFNNRRYEQALSYFSNFTNANPNDVNTANAWYWQGESHYQLGNYAAAALAYENVIANFPNSDKAPSAYLKQGMSFLALGRGEAAKERFNQLIATYPRAAEATRAQQEIVNNNL